MIQALKHQGRTTLPLMLFLFSTIPCRAEASQPFVKIDSLAYCAPTSISTAVFDDWRGKYTRGNRAWTWNWFETGLQWHRFGLSYLLRYDYDIRATDETAELLGMIKNKEDLPVDRIFNVDLEAHLFHARGIRFNYSDSFLKGKIKTTIGTSYLNADYFIDGTLHGQAHITAEKDYDYQANTSYQYTEDVLFDRQVDETYGEGFSFDFSVEGQITPSWSAALQITDLFGRIYWHDLPYTDAVANSDRKSYDQDGYVHIDSALKGREGIHQDYTQKLSPRWLINTEYQYQRYITLLEGRMQYDYFLWDIGGGIKTAVGLVTLKYWPKNKALGLEYKNKGISFSLTTDNLDIDKTKTLQLQLVYDLRAKE